MRYVPADKYNVAWFKLAECVSRGEKERALGVYRLLSHSFDDPAFARQLEGDIFFSFNDQDAAIERYADAARLYRASGRLLESLALYEHLVVLVSQKHEYITALVELCHALQMHNKLVLYVGALCALPMNHGDLARALQAVDYLDEKEIADELPTVRQQFIVAWLRTDTTYEPIMHQVIKHADYLASQEPQALQQFLTLLESIHAGCHAQLREHFQAMIFVRV